MRRVLVIWEPFNDTVRQRAIELADRLALPLAQPDDIPPDALLLVVTQRRLELRSSGATRSGPVFVDFVSESARSQRLPPRGGKELIARAIGLRHKPLFIIDATAGWAHDAFVLAQLGCRVRAIERSPVVVALVANGITRARAALRTRIDDALDRLTIEVGDARNVLSLFGVSAFQMAGPDAVSDCRERTQKKEPTTNNPGRPSARVPHGPTGLVDLIGTVFDINFCSSWYSGSRFATRAIAWRHTA